MKFLSDRAVERLRAGAEAPDLSGTRYRLLERMARGGMGVIYAVEDVPLRRRVAMKVLDVQGASESLAERLIREAHVLAQLEHPGIVPVHDVGALSDGRVYYTMKFVEGRRLDEHLSGVASLPDRMRIFQRICEAVAFAHSRGVLHRDLKPGNIMVGPFGEVLVMDWGLAKILRDVPEANRSAEEVTVISEPAPGVTTAQSVPPLSADASATAAKTAHGTVLGTPGYMAPEQARGEIEKLDERSDIYALGAILRDMLAGHSTTPKPLAAIWSKAMAEDPLGRYAGASELASDVSRYLDGLAVAAYPERVWDKLRRIYTRYEWAILLILAYLVMRVVLIFWRGR